ncbi:MAG TPA: hypothetical protein VGA22_13455 [Gemmatimonadales bacterium]
MRSREGGERPSRFDPHLHQITARLMGELQRGESRWDVLLESAPDTDVNAVRGRIHFVSGTIHRLSSWIFLEFSDKDLETRFAEFSAQDLWTLLNSLDER